jgi:CheY-like chemotaxis protein
MRRPGHTAGAFFITRKTTGVSRCASPESSVASLTNMLHYTYMENEPVAKRVLIVEDEKSLAKAMGFVITRHGFEIRTVYSGEEALEILRKEKFDMVLLDVLLPAKGGLETLQEMRSGGDKTPVIILSNLSDAETMKHAKELGAQDYLLKSSTPILQVIEQIKSYLK